MKQECSMDTATDLMDERKPVCRCSPKSAVQLWLPGFPVVLCLLMSLSSVTVCLLMTSKTYDLENRMQMDTNKAPVSETPHVAFVNDDGTLIPELAIPVGQLVQQVHVFCDSWYLLFGKVCDSPTSSSVRKTRVKCVVKFKFSDCAVIIPIKPY